MSLGGNHWIKIDNKKIKISSISVMSEFYITYREKYGIVTDNSDRDLIISKFLEAIKDESNINIDFSERGFVDITVLIPDFYQKLKIRSRACCRIIIDHDICYINIERAV